MSRADIDQLSRIVPPHENRVKSKHRRQTYTFLTLITVVLLIGLGALGNWLQWWTVGEHPNGALPCPAQTVTNPALTTVNVFNGTDRRGLAGAVAKELQTREFSVQTVSTQAQSRPIQAVAFIRYGAAGLNEARTVAREFPGKIRLVKDKRKSATVDVVLGGEYRGMTGRSKAAAAIAPKADPPGCLTASTPSPQASAAPS